MIKKIKNYITNKVANHSKIPYIILIFFLLVLTVNVIYILIASKNWNGVAVQNYYNKGLNYNETLELAKQQDKLGWQILYNFTNSTSSKTSKKLTLTIYDIVNNEIKDAQIDIKFSRPSDQNLAFIAQPTYKNERYEAEIDFIIVGKWHADFFIKRGDDIYRMKKKFIIK